MQKPGKGATVPAKLSMRLSREHTNHAEAWDFGEVYTQNSQHQSTLWTVDLLPSRMSFSSKRIIGR